VYEAQPISNAENTIHIQRHGEILICKAIDLNMGYYSMPLPDQAKKLCVLSLPWVFYQYNILPQGIIPAIDIFRREWEHFFYMPVVIIYMDASSRNQKLLMVSTICHLPGLSNYKGWHQTSAR
jgi:hypothetical protein